MSLHTQWCVNQPVVGRGCCSTWHDSSTHLTKHSFGERGLVVSQRKRDARWLLNLSAYVSSSKTPQHRTYTLQHLQKHVHTTSSSCTWCFCTHTVLCIQGQKHACEPHTWSEWSKEEETLKRHWFIFRSARVRSHHVKRVLLLINEHTIKKKGLPSNLPVLCESFMQMEFKMRWSHLQRPWLFFHSPLLKFMPPLIYKFY